MCQVFSRSDLTPLQHGVRLRVEELSRVKLAGMGHVERLVSAEGQGQFSLEWALAEVRSSLFLFLLTW